VIGWAFLILPWHSSTWYRKFNAGPFYCFWIYRKLFTKLNFYQQKLAKLITKINFIFSDNQPKNSKKSSPSPNFHLYSWHANQILADITQLRDLILDKRKEYILCSNAFSIYGTQRFMSDTDRKKFDRETGFF